MSNEQLFNRARSLGLVVHGIVDTAALDLKVNDRIRNEAISEGLDADNMSTRELHAWWDGQIRRGPASPPRNAARSPPRAARRNESDELRRQNAALRAQIAETEKRRARDELTAMNQSRIAELESISKHPEVVGLRQGFDLMARAHGCSVEKLFEGELVEAERRDLARSAERVGCSVDQLISALNKPASAPAPRSARQISPEDRAGMERMAKAMGCTVEDLEQADQFETSGAGFVIPKEVRGQKS